jgi:hypothetical protein
MTRLLIAAAVFLLLAGPWLAAEAGIPPLLAVLAGVACGVAAAMRGAQPLPAGSGAAPSPGADADARQLANHVVDYAPVRGKGITDLGGAA